jgi:hypothetical protein
MGNLEFLAEKDVLGRTLVQFGNYPQAGKDAEAEPIRWLVLNEANAKQDGSYLLLSEKVLDCVQFFNDVAPTKQWPKGEFPTKDQFYDYKKDHDVRWQPDSNEFWKRSDIGKWLNGGVWPFDVLCNYPKKNRKDFFIDRAFTADEQAQIVDHGFGKVFLLSLDEIRAYNSLLGVIMPSETFCEKRRALVTHYAREQKADKVLLIASGKDRKGHGMSLGNPSLHQHAFLPLGSQNGCAGWWTRTRGEEFGVCTVSIYGMVGVKPGKHVNEKSWGVRPAIWVKP